MWAAGLKRLLVIEKEVIFVENTNFKSTKFWTTVGVLILSYALVWAGKIEAMSWFEWAIGLVGIYSIANVANHVVGK